MPSNATASARVWHARATRKVHVLQEEWPPYDRPRTGTGSGRTGWDVLPRDVLPRDVAGSRMDPPEGRRGDERMPRDYPASGDGPTHA